MQVRRSGFQTVVCVLGVVFVSLFLGACLEQYDPKPANDQFNREWENSVRPVEKIEAAGTTAPGGDAAAGSAGDGLAEAKAEYATVCATCHGAEGGGDGVAGAALTPKPRNFHDAAWQASVDDARIIKVMKEGGAAVGLSPLMAPLGAGYSDAKMAGMVQLIRSFKK
jgi:mono/diheme cytochrome c family protein